MVTSKSVSFGNAFVVASEPINAIRRTPLQRCAAWTNRPVALRSVARGPSGTAASRTPCCLRFIFSGIAEFNPNTPKPSALQRQPSQLLNLTVIHNGRDTSMSRH